MCINVTTEIIVVRYEHGHSKNASPWTKHGLEFNVNKKKISYPVLNQRVVGVGGALANSRRTRFIGDFVGVDCYEKGSRCDQVADVQVSRYPALTYIPFGGRHSNSSRTKPAYDNVPGCSRRCVPECDDGSWSRKPRVVVKNTSARNAVVDKSHGALDLRTCESQDENNVHNCAESNTGENSVEEGNSGCRVNDWKQSMSGSGTEISRNSVVNDLPSDRVSIGRTVTTLEKSLQTSEGQNVDAKKESGAAKIVVRDMGTQVAVETSIQTDGKSVQNTKQPGVDKGTHVELTSPKEIETKKIGNFCSECGQPTGGRKAVGEGNQSGETGYFMN